MKLHVAFSAVVASSRAGVSLALEMSDGAGDKTTSSAVTFSDISDRLGPFVNGPTNVNEGTGQSSGLQGMVFFDYDNDEDLDLFICAESPVTAALFANNGDGTFQDVTDSVGLAGITDCQGVTVGDLDNDSFPDLFITGDLSKNGAFLYRNVGGTSFEDISSSSGVVSIPYNWYVNVSITDYDVVYYAILGYIVFAYNEKVDKSGCDIIRLRILQLPVFALYCSITSTGGMPWPTTTMMASLTCTWAPVALVEMRCIVTMAI